MHLLEDLRNWSIILYSSVVEIPTEATWYSYWLFQFLIILHVWILKTIRARCCLGQKSNSKRWFSTHLLYRYKITPSRVAYSSCRFRLSVWPYVRPLCPEEVMVMGRVCGFWAGVEGSVSCGGGGTAGWCGSVRMTDSKQLAMPRVCVCA